MPNKYILEKYLYDMTLNVTNEINNKKKEIVQD
jgi:hypothetical protein